MLNDKLRAVIGIWSEFFINHSHNILKFNINNTIVQVFLDNGSYIFIVEDYDLYIQTMGADVVKYCRAIKKMLERR